MNDTSSPNPALSPQGRWLTRNVMAIAMLSLFSDMSHEMVSVVLPLFLARFGGAAALGIIEGVSDAASSLMKLWMSHYSDRIGKRKPIMVVGYILTALMGLFAFATQWWEILFLRVMAWMGRGARGPVRDAMLAESVDAGNSGRAFGFEGAMDTLGAVIGPAIALSLIGIFSYRLIFLISFVPGIITILIVTLVLKDVVRTANHSLRLLASLKALPGSFWKYTAVVGVFGFGNFAHTLLILRVVALLAPRHGTTHAGQIALGLYILHNVLYAAMSYPMGALGDRVDKRKLLAFGSSACRVIHSSRNLHSHRGRDRAFPGGRPSSRSRFAGNRLWCVGDDEFLR